MLKEILPNFGENPDIDAMAMERKPIIKRFTNQLLQTLNKGNEFKPKLRRKGLISEDTFKNQDLL